MHHKSAKTDHEAKQFQIACAYLFSPQHAKDQNFIETLNRSIIKKAFREKAKRYHPDLHRGENDEMILKRKERFVKIKASYEYLFKRVQDDIHSTKKTSVKPFIQKPTIIAVGGAKGGIGKSLFASNLSVYLSQKGIRTVAADLDLGGANLHLYLGKTRLGKHINDFFDQKKTSLDDIMEETRFGPKLIGGNSARLGAANIAFARKLKLLKAIKTINADCVVVDLGGDTSYNILDFFLAADQGIVMTTCDPASYLEAYTFIKVALYRKLNRLFGPESSYTGKPDMTLKRLIQEATNPKEGKKVPDMDSLIAIIKKECPLGIPILNQALNEFSPHIIVNKVDSEKSAFEPVNRIQMVARKKLNITVNHLCNIPFHPEIEKSARTLVPWVVTSINSDFSHALEKVSRQLLKRS